jgi:hypothetical protein
MLTSSLLELILAKFADPKKSMKSFVGATTQKNAGLLLTIFSICLSLSRAQAQPTIVSTVPANGATGVSTSAVVVITFSQAMNTTATTAYIIDSSTFAILPASSAWSGGNKILTCTPSAAFPPGRVIYWTVNGENPAGQHLTGTTGGEFTTAPNGMTLTNASWANGTFSFEVLSLAGQALTIESTTTLRSNQWSVLLTTNSPGGRVKITDPQSSANRYRFYRARTGS